MSWDWPSCRRRLPAGKENKKSQLTIDRYINYNKRNYLNKCNDKEEYIDTGSQERRWMVEIFVMDVWK